MTTCRGMSSLEEQHEEDPRYERGEPPATRPGGRAGDRAAGLRDPRRVRSTADSVEPPEATSLAREEARDPAPVTVLARVQIRSSPQYENFVGWHCANTVFQWSRGGPGTQNLTHTRGNGLTESHGCRRMSKQRRKTKISVRQEAQAVLRAHVFV